MLFRSKADNTGTFTAPYLADTLVKHGQANPYTDGYSKRRQDIGFPLPGVAQARHFSYTLARFLPPNGHGRIFLVIASTVCMDP